MHAYRFANSMFDSPVTNLLSILCIWIEIPLRGHAKAEGGWGGGAGGGGGASVISNLALSLVVFRVTTQQA